MHDSLTPRTEHRTTLLREVRPDDLEALYGLDQLCFEPGISYSRAEIRRFLGLASARGVVAQEGDTLAGFAIGYLPRPGAGHILTLDVHPSWRGRGIGRRLLSELISGLAERGARRVALEVDVGNSGAIAFYRRLGFVADGRLADYYGPGRDGWRMSMALTGAQGSLAASRPENRD